MVALREVALRAGAYAIVGLSFWIYFDGLDRLSNLEATLWAAAVLLAGLSALLVGSVPSVGAALLAPLLYAVRTRR